MPDNNILLLALCKKQQNKNNKNNKKKWHTGVLGEVGSSKLVCFLELDRPRALEFARFRFSALEDPERLRDFSSEPSPPSPSPCDSFFVMDGTSSFSYD